jgi:hypothetical protein
MKNSLLLIGTFTIVTFCAKAQWNQTITSPVNVSPTTTISNSNLVNKFNLPTTDGSAANFSILSNNWDLGGGYGLIEGANVVSPVVWLYNFGGRNAFTVASKNYSAGQGQGVIGDYLNPLFQVRENGNVGIGTITPGAKLDVGTFIYGGTLGTVFGRLQEGNSSGAGTFLGVRGYDTQPTNTKSFAIEHSFYGNVNSSINFNRGGGTTGGFMTFNTDANTEQVRITNTGNVGIGTTSPGSFKLAVEGKIGAREVNVTTNAWSDYVFNEEYKLRPLEEVNRYIKENKHLPEIPSAEEVIANGQNLGEMNKLLVKKIEELTLYMIELKKENEVMKARVEILEKKK